METTKRFLTKLTPYDEGGEDGVLLMRLGNGQELRLEVGKLAAELQRRGMFHGLAQKLGDAAAGCSKDNAYGAAFAAMQGVWDNLLAGKWNAGREGGGISDLVTAIARLKKLPVEDVRVAVAKASEDTLKQWKGNAKIQLEVAKIRMERAKVAAAGSDPDDIEIEMD